MIKKILLIALAAVSLQAFAQVPPAGKDVPVGNTEGAKALVRGPGSGVPAGLMNEEEIAKVRAKSKSLSAEEIAKIKESEWQEYMKAEQVVDNFLAFMLELLPYPDDVAMATIGDLKVSSVDFYGQALFSPIETKSKPLPGAEAIHEWVKTAVEKMGFHITGSPKDPKLKFAIYCETGQCVGFSWIIRDVSIEYSHNGGPKKVATIKSVPVMNWKGVTHFDESLDATARSQAAFELSKKLLADMSKSIMRANLKQ